MKELSVSDHAKIIRFIGRLSHLDCARLVRFSKIGNPIFRMNLPFYEIFEKRFADFGGMTKRISKQLGWKEWGDCPRWEDFK